MPTVWRGRHRLIFCWLLCMLAVSPGRQTLAEMARWTPAAITAWRFGRLLQAVYGHVPLLVRWLAQARLATWPAPAHGLGYLCGDGRHADTRGTKHPVTQQGRIRQQHPWFCGLRFVRLRAAWEGYRLPVGLRLILPKRHPGSRSAHALLREMGGEFVPPRWAKLVRVGGEAADGSKANRRLVQARDTAETTRRWGLVCAIARTWKTGAEPTLQHLVTPVPHSYDPRPPVPREGAGTGRRTCWTYQTRGCWRQVGEVTVVLSKTGRTTGPHTPTRLVPNLAAWTPRPVVRMSQKRWAIALRPWEWKAGRGLGAPQGSGNKERREQSVGMAVLAYVFGLRVGHHEIVPGKPWRIFQLQHALRLRAMTNQVEHTVKVKMAKTRKVA
jgi:hypothetical protein